MIANFTKGDETPSQIVEISGVTYQANHKVTTHLLFSKTDPLIPAIHFVRLSIGCHPQFTRTKVCYA